MSKAANSDGPPPARGPEGGLSPKPTTTPAHQPTGTRPSARRWALVAVLGVALAVAASLAYRASGRTQALEHELALAEASEESAAATVDLYDDVAAADRLLLAGRYREAGNAYRALAADSARSQLAPGVDLEARLDHIGLLRAYAYELDTLRALAGQPPRKVFVELPAAPRPATVAPLALASSRPGQYDSLNFALRKAEMRIRSLEGRLRQNSGGNYLTFESSRGSDVYYVGDVRGGRANGKGVALLSTGSRYQGEWRDNRRHGRGTFYWPDGAYYEGAYADDERDGQGTYHFPDGSVFVGDWEADLRNGEGVYYDKDGEVVARGIWDDDELVERFREAG